MSNSAIELIKRICTDSNVSFGSNFTHVITYPEIQKYNVGPMDYKDFWIEYCKLVGDDALVCLAEKIPDNIPLILDLNLKFREEEGLNEEDYYSEIFILSVISCIQQVIINNFQIDADTKKELICVFLLSEVPFFLEEIIDNENIRTINIGMRFQFPYCRTNPNFINDMIYPEILANFDRSNIYKTLDKATVFKSWREIIDKDLIKRGYIHLYGSVSNPLESSRKFNKIYLAVTKDHIEGNQDLDVVDNITRAIPLNAHPHVINRFLDIEIIREFLGDDDDDNSFWTPLLLSIYNLSAIITNNKPKAKKPLYLTKSQELDAPFKLTDDKISRFDNFYKMCKPARFENKMYALDLGRVIYSVYEGGDDGLNRWINLSNNPDFCRENYYSFYNSNITLNTLAYYAREDSPSEFRRWNKSWMIESINKILKSGSIYDHDVGEFVYRLGWLDFAYSIIGKEGIWYKYNNPRWLSSGKGIDIKSYISTFVVGVTMEYIDVLIQESVAAQDEVTKSIKQNNIQVLQKLIARMKNIPSKSRFMASLEEYFYIRDFNKYLDDNVTCIAHMNCVSEVIDKKVEFRPGKPEDYISKSTGVRIDKNMTWEHPKVKEVVEWLRKLFPDDDLREFMLKYNGSWFEGGNYDKIGPCLYGKSNGGKSTFIKSLEACWGEYCFKFQNSTVYAKKGSFNSSGPSPEIAQAKGSRGGIVDELEDDIEISAGVIKKYLGGDSFFCRMLHDNGGKTKVTFKMMFVCNRIPKMNSMDESIKGKFIIIPFLSTWANNVTPEMMKNNPYLHQADPSFEFTIPSRAAAMMWIFAQYYHNYKTEGLKIPILVRNMTEKYWKDIDHFSLFKNQKIVKVADVNTGLPNKDAKLEISRLFCDYKVWFKQTFENERVTSYRDFKLEFTRILGDLDETESFWYGYQMKDQGNEMTGADKMKAMIH